MLRILIADDHQIVRVGLKCILEETPDMRMTGEASNGQEVLDMVSRNEYDLIVLDFIMPGKNGLEVLRELTPRYPDLPVLMLSMSHPEQYSRSAMEAGASGFLSKESLSEELVSTIRAIVAKQQENKTSSQGKQQG